MQQKDFKVDLSPDSKESDSVVCKLTDKIHQSVMQASEEPKFIDSKSMPIIGANNQKKITLD